MKRFTSKQHSLLALYLILVILGLLAILRRSQTPFDYTAERALARNHRLLASDIRSPDVAWALAPGLHPQSQYVGQYLDRCVSAGEPVKREYLRSRPLRVAANGAETFSWFLREGEQRWLRILDVGWSVDLCDGNDCPVLGATVQALDCANHGAAVCAVVLQLKPDEKQVLLRHPGKQNLSVSVSSIDGRIDDAYSMEYRCGTHEN